MFIDEITLQVAAGNGGDGVVRWRHDKYKPMAGPAGGDGGKGGDVYVRAVRDISVLGRYTGEKKFAAASGEAGHNGSKTGKGGDDLYIDVPIGTSVRDREKGRVFEVLTEGETVRIYKGGAGGLGNEYFKSSVNRSPEKATKGKEGERGLLHIELSLVVDAGMVGFPNAGKSSLINALTNAQSKVGAYAFTTKSPQLGELYGYVLADIPGLIEGAAAGKGLGHSFLRHIARTKMLLHVISLDSADPKSDYYTIRKELSSYDASLTEKEEWIIFNKMDLVNKDFIEGVLASIDIIGKRVFVVSAITGEGVKEFSDALVAHLREPYNKA
ncbi:GTPase ObgE [Patescibacteria group bacterium]|nr:GTPase ObgE [Patescibacteria group bacterium]